MKTKNISSETVTANGVNTVLPAVYLTSGWKEILGIKQADMPDDVRRQRWELWKSKVVEKLKTGPWIWEENDDCKGCIHCENDWCNLQQLPCIYNPITTPETGDFGMACCGIGKCLVVLNGR